MKINWKVRIRNKTFWVSMIPALILLIQQICNLFGITVELSGTEAQLVGIAETVFVILALLGIVTDPTTAGISDSDLAMCYQEPKKH
jgi:phi LC3 family holin